MTEQCVGKAGLPLFWGHFPLPFSHQDFNLEKKVFVCLFEGFIFCSSFEANLVCHSLCLEGGSLKFGLWGEGQAGAFAPGFPISHCLSFTTWNDVTPLCHSS